MVANVYAYDDSTDVAGSLAKHILRIERSSIEKFGSFKIAVSGGSLGKVLKTALIDNKDVLNQVQWDKWTVYFSDERLVPFNHEDSNCGLFIALVIDHLPDNIPKPKIVGIDETLLSGENGLRQGSNENQDIKIAQTYESNLPKDKKLDLVLLGCGPDGHTCSLFPGHELLNEKSKFIAYIKDSPKPPSRRITFTLPLLELASSIAFVAEGESKAPILKEIFNDKASKLPAKLVNDLSIEVNWFVNTPAVKGVDLIVSKY